MKAFKGRETPSRTAPSFQEIVTIIEAPLIEKAHWTYEPPKIPNFSAIKPKKPIQKKQHQYQN
jgi:hypothetical protein